MEIIRYHEEKKSLFVKYNTKIVWQYNRISAEMYKKIRESKTPEKYVRDLFRIINSVGVVKEDI